MPRSSLETAESGITWRRHLPICPGYVLTPLVEKQIPDTAKARGMTEDEVKRDVLLAAQWAKTSVTVEQLAGVAIFLRSDIAGNIAGVALPVDGGWTAAGPAVRGHRGTGCDRGLSPPVRLPT